MEWMLMPLKRYADFSGRSRRMEYWMFALLNAIVGGLIVALMLAGGLPLADREISSAAEASSLGPLIWVGVLLLLVWVLAVFIPSIAVTVRRLHDRDMSGWWYPGLIVASMIPLVGIIASIALIVLMCLDGTPGPNRFGADPKERGAAPVIA